MVKRKGTFVSGKRGDKKDSGIFSVYIVITLLLLAFAGCIVWAAIKIGFKEKDGWLKLAEQQKRSDVLVSPTRGNIYSDDDRLMATSTPQYYLHIDFQANGFKEGGKGVNIDTFLHSKTNGIDSLSYCLSKKLTDRTPAGYKAHLMKGLRPGKKKPSRRYQLSDKRVSYTDLKEIKSFPFFRYGRNTSGLYEKEMMTRQKPFDKLASRTVGDIYNEIDSNGLTKGRYGLELQYDTLLRGKSGISSQKRVGGRWTNVVQKEPTHGMDIRTTIDINIQDLTEKALLDKLKELDAFAGTAVVMEVKTGEIKAITNMERIGSGRYSEAMNHAVADVIEPGSTFKVAAMMVAIEDGVANPHDPVDVGNGLYKVGNRTMTDHNANRGGYGMITAEKSIWYSSNIGVAKVVMKGYGNNPKKFVDGLHRIGMDADLKLEIPGAGKAKLRWPTDKYWSNTSLPWMSFGYEVQIPPIQTLTFFNAIANNGKMVRPMFVKDFLKDGRSVKHFEPEIIIDKICSEKTLEVIRDMLYHVVNYKDPTPSRRDGTGKPAKSDVITIAGKTGTAQIASGGGYRMAGHNVSFCGFFPYEKPMYTCIVVISKPRNGAPSGGLMCGTVVKEIAEKIYSNCTVLDIAKMSADSLKADCPKVKNGDYMTLKNAMKEFKLKLNGKSDSQYVVVDADEEKGLSIKGLPLIDNLVPNVVGMGAKDAVFALESRGLNVALNGKGRVTSQSIQNGSKIVKGQTITLTLK